MVRLTIGSLPVREIFPALNHSCPSSFSPLLIKPGHKYFMPFLSFKWRRSRHTNEIQPYTVHDLVYNSFCPIVTCSTLGPLRHRKSEVSAWLGRQFKAELGRPSFTDVGILQRLNIVMIGQLRLFEFKFGVALSWKGCSEDTTSMGEPFYYHPEVLASYYTELATFHSKRAGCTDCREGHTEQFLDDANKCLDFCLRWQAETHHHSQPDFNVMSRAQLSAWSFHVSLISVAILGFWVNDLETVAWCRTLIHSSTACVETALVVSGLRVGGSMHAIQGESQIDYSCHSFEPPPYTP